MPNAIIHTMWLDIPYTYRTIYRYDASRNGGSQPGGRMTWAPRLLPRDAPLYLALADCIAADMAAGRLTAGERLPTHRALAATLDVDLTTITRAYAEARRRGLLIGHVGRGTFVRGAAMAAASSRFGQADAVVDLSQNLPPQLDPDLPALALAETLGELSRAPEAGHLLRYHDNAGMEAHRDAGASWVSQRVPDADASRVVLTNGAQHAISVLIAMLAEPGDTVMTEAMTYPAFRSAAEQARLRVQGLEMDEEGLAVDAFRRACKAGSRLLYTTPTLHNPTTISMSGRRRAALARIAREFGVRIIEDDVYGILADGAPAPLATYAPELTFFISSLTKAVAGGLRIGYVLCPTPGDADRVSAVVRVTTWMAPPLMAHIASRWVRSRTARDILKAHRAEATRRQTIANRIMARFAWRSERFAYNGWLELPRGWSTAEFVSQARRARIAVTPSDAFWAASSSAPPAVRLSLTASPDREAVGRALEEIAHLLAVGPRTSSAVL